MDARKLATGAGEGRGAAPPQGAGVFGLDRCEPGVTASSPMHPEPLDWGGVAATHSDSQARFSALKAFLATSVSSEEGGSPKDDMVPEE